MTSLQPSALSLHPLLVHQLFGADLPKLLD